MLTKFAIDPERRAEILRIVRRAAVIVIPVVGFFLFAGLLAWTVRHQLNSLTEGLAVDEPTDEPTYEMPAEVVPV